jgi:diguanylate cyclase (GGDEF)-like protein
MRDKTMSIGELTNKNFPCGMFAFKAAGDVSLLYFDERTLSLFECENEEEFLELTGGTFPGMIVPEDRKEAYRSIRVQSQAFNGTFDHVVYRIRTKSGKVVAVESFGRFVDDETRGPLFTAISVTLSPDAVKRHFSETNDELTGLMGRKAFVKGLSEIINEEGSSGDVSVVYFNITNLKFFNARNGVEAGDQLLRKLALLLKREFEGDLISRFSHDHFYVATKKKDIDLIAARINDILNREDDMREVQVKAGIRHVSPDEENIPVIICDEAKIACDTIKNRIDISHAEFYEDMRNQAEQNAYMAANLDLALDRGDIHVYFQPVVRTMTGKLNSMEALTRWEDPLFGQISPAVFIPALENSHAIHRLDAFVIREICRINRSRIDEGLPVIPISFNLSRTDFVDSNPYEIIEDAATTYDIPHNCLRIEITETSLANNEKKVGSQIRLLRKAGYQVWMDDFGAGYSSLGLLKDYEFDGIKFDASLIRNLNDRGMNIMASVIEMAKSLGSHTLAEGAETMEQIRFLHSIGCEEIQGFYYAKPMPYEKCIEYCRENNIKLESSEDANALDKVGMFNTSTSKPVALLWDEESNTKIFFANNAFSDIMAELGAKDENDYERLLDLQPTGNSQTIRQLMDKASETGNEEAVLMLEDKPYMRVSVKEMSRTKAYRIFSLSIEGLNTDADIKTLLAANDVLNNILTIYREIYFFDYESNTCKIIKSPKFEDNDARRYTDIEYFFKEYSEKVIHPNDRETFKEMFNFNFLQEMAKANEENFFSATFHQRRGNKGYLRTEYTAIFLDMDSGDNKLLLCVKDSPYDNFASKIKQVHEAPNNTGVTDAALPDEMNVPIQDVPAENSEPSNRASSIVSNEPSTKTLATNSTASVEQNDFGNRMNEFLAEALGEEDSDAGIQEFISNIGRSLNADRSYIFEENGDSTFSNTYEWCSDHIIPEKSLLQSIEHDRLAPLMDLFEDTKAVIIPDVEKVGKELSGISRFLSERNVRNIAAAPLEIGGVRIGYFAIDNPAPDLLQEVKDSGLKVMAYFISIMMRNRDVVSHLDYLSLRDDLTGILNRRGLDKYVRALEPGIRLVIVYADINYLKDINDSMGHEAGDEMIMEAGKTMLEIAGRGHVFRIGGDEFTMTFELKEGEPETAPIERLRKRFAETDISIALGYSVTTTPTTNIETVLSKADRRMYEDKMNMHANR